MFLSEKKKEKMMDGTWVIGHDKGYRAGINLKKQH